MSRGRFLDLAVVQEELGISKEEVVALVSTGELLAVHFLGKWRVERQGLERFLCRVFINTAANLGKRKEVADLSDELGNDVGSTEDVERSSPEIDHAQHADLKLTPQMLRVLTLVADGMSNSEIADELSLEISTIKSHVSRLLSRLKVPTRERLIAFAWRSGLASGAATVGRRSPTLPSQGPS